MVQYFRSCFLSLFHELLRHLILSFILLGFLILPLTGVITRSMGQNDTYGLGCAPLSAFPSLVSVLVSAASLNNSVQTWCVIKGEAQKESRFLKVRFWQNGYFADLYVWAAGLFRSFGPRISLIFAGRMPPEKSFRKSPAKSFKIYTTKSPAHLCRGAGPDF